MGIRYEAEVCTNEIYMNGTFLTADVFRATLQVSWPSSKQTSLIVLSKCAQLNNFSLYLQSQDLHAKMVTL